jgi:hypothetical protein
VLDTGIRPTVLGGRRRARTRLSWARDVVELRLVDPHPGGAPQRARRVVSRRHGRLRRGHDGRSGAVRQRKPPSSPSCPGHLFRKGYYLGLAVDYACVFCGQPASEDELSSDRTHRQR